MHTEALAGKEVSFRPCSCVFCKGAVKRTAQQFLLAEQIDQETFSQLPVIKVIKKNNKKWRRAFEALGSPPTGRIPFQQFLNKEGDYLQRELWMKPNENEKKELRVCAGNANKHILITLNLSVHLP